MAEELKKAVKELARLASLQVKHHGHGCGYGNFPRGNHNNFCDICTPTVKAVTKVRKLMRGGRE